MLFLMEQSNSFYAHIGLHIFSFLCYDLYNTELFYNFCS